LPLPKASLADVVSARSTSVLACISAVSNAGRTALSPVSSMPTFVQPGSTLSAPIRLTLPLV
jgi:hypothetical protein